MEAQKDAHAIKFNLLEVVSDGVMLFDADSFVHPSIEQTEWTEFDGYTSGLRTETWEWMIGPSSHGSQKSWGHQSVSYLQNPSRGFVNG